MPNVNRVNGILYKPGDVSKEKAIEFDAERISGLPQAGTIMSGGAMTHYAKLSTDNRIVAYLSKTHRQAQETLGSLSANSYTNEQYKAFIAYTTPEERSILTNSAGPMWPIISKSIEAALTPSKTKDGKVDLEDTMAIARLGAEKVSEAQRISTSLDYRVYRDAKYADGKPIISKKEQRFINQWLAYYHADID